MEATRGKDTICCPFSNSSLTVCSIVLPCSMLTFFIHDLDEKMLQDLTFGFPSVKTAFFRKETQQSTDSIDSSASRVPVHLYLKWKHPHSLKSCKQIIPEYDYLNTTRVYFRKTERSSSKVLRNSLPRRREIENSCIYGWRFVH